MVEHTTIAVSRDNWQKLSQIRNIQGINTKINDVITDLLNNTRHDIIKKVFSIIDSLARFREFDGMNYYKIDPVILKQRIKNEVE